MYQPRSPGATMNSAFWTLHVLKEEKNKSEE
jgi:hypothetical protein